MTYDGEAGADMNCACKLIVVETVVGLNFKKSESQVSSP